MKYARGARQNAEAQEEYTAVNRSYYDDELTGDDGFAVPQQDAPAEYEQDEPVAYDAYANDYPVEPQYEQPVQQPARPQKEKRGLFGGKKKKQKQPAPEVMPQ